MSVAKRSPSEDASMVEVRASLLYPKKKLVETTDEDIVAPFSPLCGESIEFMGRTADRGILALSNYRLYNQRSADGKADYNIPLGLVETVEMRDLFHVYINCKDAKTCRCSFSTNDACVDWFRRLLRAITPPKNVDELFAFVYFAWANEENYDQISAYLGRDTHLSPIQVFSNEVERMKFDVSEVGVWRISYVNNDYSLCPSYPRFLLVPSRISDNVLETAARFRSTRRVPVVVWRHKENGAVIARCSQPEVGWLGWRSTEDEELLRAIADSCILSCQTDALARNKKLLIMDARSYTTAVANRARGGGCECAEYYPRCEILFMNLANIHSIRKSFNALRQLCASPSDQLNQLNWHSLLEGTRWLQNMSMLMQSAARVLTAIEVDSQPVLVHCSDGWDRTSQIVSLAQLLLDPYYRTIQGFQVLCEREWLNFGHKFADRCGIGEDQNEKCPVFLQWLDCVHNVLSQFPCSFEFSKRYLVKLAEHTYSNLFGTFLCNTSSERATLAIAERTFSVWRYLGSPHFRNYLYNPDGERVLWPKYNVRDLHVWLDLYTNVACDRDFHSTEHLLNVFTPDDSPILNGDEDAVSAEYRQLDLTNSGGDSGGDAGVDLLLESAINCQPDEMTTSWTAGAELQNAPFTDGDVVHIASEIAQCQVKSDELDGSVGTIEEECGAIRDETRRTILELADACATEEGVPKMDGKLDHNYSLSLSKSRMHLVAATDNIATSKTKSAFTNASTAPTLCKSSKDASFTSSPLTLPLTIAKTMTNSEPLLLDPIDGLPLIADDIQDRMRQIVSNHKAREAALERELHATRLALVQKMCHRCSVGGPLNGIVNAEKGEARVELVVPEDDVSICSTEVSWEAVEENETQPTLWMPDHAVNQCMACDNKFWLGRRKHHCRSCGKIFCGDCSSNLVPVPNEQLYEPVRVCRSCYGESSRGAATIADGVGTASANSQTCKQAAADEAHCGSRDIFLPSPSSHY